MLPIPDFLHSFEVIGTSFQAQNKVIRAYNIYQPPPSATNTSTDSLFLEEVSDFLSHVAVLENVVILGDFNKHSESHRKIV